MDQEDLYDQYLMECAAKNYRKERNSRVRSVIAWVLLVLYICLAPYCAGKSGADEKQLRIAAYPAVQLWRRGVQIRTSVFIEPNASNHCVELQWRFTWPGGGGSSTFEIDESSQRQFTRWISHGTPGRVWFVGILHQVVDGKDVYKRVEAEALLAGGGNEEEGSEKD